MGPRFEICSAHFPGPSYEPLHRLPERALVAPLVRCMLFPKNIVQYFPRTVYLWCSRTMTKFCQDIRQSMPLDKASEEPGPFLDPRVEFQRVRVFSGVDGG